MKDTRNCGLIQAKLCEPGSVFRTVLRALDLPDVKRGQQKPLDLGSLRAGGSTWTLMMTENPELVRRRGRWINSKTMEIYFQQISSVQYMSNLPHETKTKILSLAAAFPYLLRKISQLSRQGIDAGLWRFLLREGHPPQSASKQVGGMGVKNTP